MDHLLKTLCVQEQRLLSLSVNSVTRLQISSVRRNDRAHVPGNQSHHVLICLSISLIIVRFIKKIL